MTRADRNVPLIRVLEFKIGLTVVFWCVPLLLFPSGLLNALGFPVPEPQVINVSDQIDTEIARLKLNAMGFQIDELTAEQRRYLSSWESGT